MNFDRRLLLAPLGALFLLGTACDASDPDAGLTAGTYVTKLDDVFCQRYVECGGAGSFEQCHQNYWLDEGSVSTWGPRLAEVASGRIHFDAASAQACLDAMAKASCLTAVGFEDITTADPSCLHVFEGAVEVDGTCNDLGGRATGDWFLECQPGLDCVMPETCEQGQCCAGTCLHGDFLTHREGDGCVDSSQCAVGLACQADHECHAPLQAGDRCAGFCFGDTVCVGSTCITPPEVEDRVTSCDGLSDTNQCDATHYCSNGTCFEEFGAGHACGPQVGWCDYFFRCDEPSGTCVAKASVGQACALDSDCLGSPSVCRAGVCVAPAANGAACEANSECLSHYCIAGVCDDWTHCPDAAAPAASAGAK